MTRTEHPATDRLSSAVDSGVVLALGTALGWTLLELTLRRGAVPLLEPLVGSAFAADWAVLLVGSPAIAALLSWIALRRGQSPGTWEYDVSLRAVAAGVGGVVVGLVATVGAAYVDSVLFGAGETGAAFTAAVAETLQANPALALLLVLGNGLAAPVAEEQVWRGIVQTDLVDAWGPAVGVGLTAALFSLKHVVVDLSLARTTTVLALGLVFGAVRHRFGTASSTVTHAGVNTLSTASVVVAALG